MMRSQPRHLRSAVPVRSALSREVWGRLFRGGIALGLSLAPAALCCAAGTNFPTARTCLSPDLRWQIRCETMPQSDGGYRHTLQLGRFATSDAKPVWVSERSCDVLWSGDSQRFAVTDWTGSNVAEIFLVELATTKAIPLDVKSAQALILPAELAGHCYYEALRWETPQRLRIRVFGHTDENPSHGFTYYFSIETDSGRATLIKHHNEEASPQGEAKS